MANKTSEIQLQKETLRIETFSDGVFCIAVTLLSIEIGVEMHGDVTNKELTLASIGKWPIYLAYVISFVNVLLAWIGHHSLFKMLHKLDNSDDDNKWLIVDVGGISSFSHQNFGRIFTDWLVLNLLTIFYTGYFVLISLAFPFTVVCRFP